MKLKYQRLSKEEQKKQKAKFLQTKESKLYLKAGRILNVAIIGFIFSIFTIIYDIVYKSGTINYVMDAFLFIFTLIFIIIMRNIKLNEINAFVINQNKKNKKS